jgi:hypothetical protein
MATILSTPVGDVYAYLVEEVADALGVNEEDVWRWLQFGLLHSEEVDGQVWIEQAELEWLFGIADQHVGDYYDRHLWWRFEQWQREAEQVTEQLPRLSLAGRQREQVERGVVPQQAGYRTHKAQRLLATQVERERSRHPQRQPQQRFETVWGRQVPMR